jgi:hypothetical protein
MVGLANNESEECGRKRPRSKFLADTEQDHEGPQNIRLLAQDLKPVLLEYGAGGLTTRPRRSVCCV